MDSAVGQTSDRRRASRRRTAEEHGIVAARVRPGYEVVVIDISADGALVETVYRLLPGTYVDLQLDVVRERVPVRGRVLRCAVVSVRPWSIVYRGAILFDSSLGWLRDGNELPGTGGSHRAAATHAGR